MVASSQKNLGPNGAEPDWFGGGPDTVPLIPMSLLSLLGSFAGVERWILLRFLYRRRLPGVLPPEGRQTYSSLIIRRSNTRVCSTACNCRGLLLRVRSRWEVSR